MKLHIFCIVLLAAYVSAEDDGQYHPEGDDGSYKPENRLPESESGYHWAEDGSYKLVPNHPARIEEWKAESGAYPVERIIERPRKVYYKFEDSDKPKPPKPTYSYYRYEEPYVYEERPSWYRSPAIRHRYYDYEPYVHRYSYDPERFYETEGYYPKK